MINKHYILLWMLIFPPVAIYKCFKHKIFSKRTNIILTVLLSLLTILVSISVIVSFMNPSAVLDKKVEEKLQEKNLGQIREIEYKGLIDEEIGAYELITTKGFYNVYISAEDSKNVKIEGIKDVINDKTLDSSESFSEIYQKLNPETLEFFIKKPEYQEDIKDVIHEDKYDIITYKDGTKLKFVNEYYQVSKVFEIENKKEELVYNREVLIEFRDDFRRIVDDRMNVFKEIKEIKEYRVNNNEIYYIFTNFCDNEYKLIKYNDGSYELQGANFNVSEERVDELWKENKSKEK